MDRDDWRGLIAQCLQSEISLTQEHKMDKAVGQHYREYQHHQYWANDLHRREEPGKGIASRGLLVVHAV